MDRNPNIIDPKDPREAMYVERRMGEEESSGAGWIVAAIVALVIAGGAFWAWNSHQGGPTTATNPSTITVGQGTNHMPPAARTPPTNQIPTPAPQATPASPAPKVDAPATPTPDVEQSPTMPKP